MTILEGVCRPHRAPPGRSSRADGGERTGVEASSGPEGNRHAPWDGGDQVQVAVDDTHAQPPRRHPRERGISPGGVSGRKPAVGDIARGRGHAPDGRV